MEDKLNEIIKIFVYLFSRDAFFKHYQKLFSNRLLNVTTKSKDAETKLIAKFKTEAGQVAISKIQTMLNDINQTEEIIQETKKEIEKETNIQFTPNILTNGCWPLTSE